MGINIRQKGAGGEREIVDDLNYIIYLTMQQMLCDNPTMQSVQRNQNQSAVGGADLTGTLGLSIEVKRQEQLAINTWWAQCVASAEQDGGVPVLLYRQNGKKWKCVTNMELPFPAKGGLSFATMQVRAEMDYDTFKSWFKAWVVRHLNNGGRIVV